MAALATPDWFSHDCDHGLPAGLQIVVIQRSADDSGLPGRLFIDHDGRVWIPAELFSSWTGYRPPPVPARMQNGQAWHPLGGIPHRVDGCEARLQIARHQPPHRYALAWTEPATRLQPGPGLVLNLDLASQAGQGGSRESAVAELGVSTPQGYLRHRERFSHDMPNQPGAQRLDTQFRHDLVSDGESVVAGDQISSNRLGSPVLYGGISWGSDFSQRPELPTYPLPVIPGSAALPSTAELYVNGQLRQRQSVDSGAYLLSSPALMPGAGQLQVVTRDLLGRETRVNQPYYVSPQLLRPGLTDYHVDLGWLREGLGSPQDRYGSAFGSVDWRRGLDGDLTAGAHADLQPGSLSLQGEWLSSALASGLTQLTGGLSRDDRAGIGQALGMAREWRSSTHYLAGNYRYASPAFVELGRTPGAIAQRLGVQAAEQLGGGVQISAGWLREVRRDREDIDVRTLGAQLQQGSRQWFLNLAGNPAQGWSRSLGLFQTLTPGHSLTLLLQQTSDARWGGLLQWSWQPVNSPWSWRAGHQQQAGQGTSTVSAQYNGERGSGNVVASEDPAGSRLLSSLSTGLAWVPGNLLWGRRINDSVVVADVGAPGVRVYRDNQPVARSNASGQAMISDLRPHVPVQLSLDNEDLPITVQPVSVDLRLRPVRGLSWVALTLPPATWRSRWQARLADGTLLPAGSQIRQGMLPADLPSGLDGLLYLPAGWMHHAIDITLPDGRHCHIASLPASPEVICALLP